MSVLVVRGLTKKYAGFLLDGVSFELRPGRTMGLIGKNGAGKTTTLKSLLNLVKPDAGQVLMFGKDFYQNEQDCKQQVEWCSRIDFYRHKRAVGDHQRYETLLQRVGRTGVPKVHEAVFLGPKQARE